eukprot:1657574-Amphidinium_carterae.1
MTRPALDSVGAAMDRLRRPRWQLQRMWTAAFEAPVQLTAMSEPGVRLIVRCSAHFCRTALFGPSQ